MNLINANFLFASLIWGSIGVGYFIFGRKQREVVPMSAGLVMIVVSYIVGSALLMSLLCLALMVAVYVVMKRDR